MIMDHGTLHDEVSRLAEIRHTKAFLNLFPRHVLFIITLLVVPNWRHCLPKAVSEGRYQFVDGVNYGVKFI